MFKVEDICHECGGHYAVVTKGEEDIRFCPLCGTETIYSDDDDEDNE